MVDDIEEEYSEEEYVEEPQPEAPQETPQEPQPEKKSGLPKAIMTMAILVAGMYAIIFILEYYIENFAETLNIDMAMIAPLTELAYLFIYLMAGIMAILTVIYIITKLRKPTKSL